MAGGGTAGHLQPALAIAEAMVARGHPRTDIEFVGSSRARDREVLEGRGFPITLLPGRGIIRSLHLRAVVRNVGAVAGLTVAVGRGCARVARTRPNVVVSVGGYASLPASIGALVFRIPLVLVNVDAVPGAANRLFGRFARASAVGWAGTPLPRSVVTGTPVRPEIAAVGRTAADRSAARCALGLPPERSTVVIFGGSLGARKINEAAADLAERWASRDDCAIFHIVGRRDWEMMLAPAPVNHGLVVVRVPYEDRMATVYSAADVVVCRAGAMTVAELAMAGVPAILVPLPGAPGDHQTANARVLERGGGALVLADSECDGERLEQLLGPLLSGDGGLDAMGQANASMGRPDAAEAGALVIEEHARPPGQRDALR
jgi:UDP-N-acetylglucosamine--N-acetylmuramyl-(pentapeptide) pyrophosphoryl-undecaprenol N-acetylglucosamine transferase